MDEYKAREILSDAIMRKRLLELLLSFKEKVNSATPEPLPMPMMDDDQVRKELKRILGFKF